MFKNRSIPNYFCLLLIAGLGLSCSDKKEKNNYDVINSSEIMVVDLPFKIEIDNTHLMTVQEIQYEGKKMGDFFKIESHHYKREGEGKKMMVSKSYLVNAEKYNRVKALLMEQMKQHTAGMVISKENPALIAISVGEDENLKSVELDSKTAAPFETALFNLLDGEPKSKPIEIPTH